jgi:tripartite motif-containing protein 71
MKNRFFTTMLIIAMTFDILVGIAGAAQFRDSSNLGNCTSNVTVVANFTSSVTAGYVPFSVKFTDLSQNATAWKWDFGDGSKSYLKNPSHKYSKVGKYKVSLKVTHGKLSDTITKTNYITVNKLTPPKAIFTDKVSGSKVTFTDKSSGALIKWKWNFGDGNTSIDQNPTHIYKKAGKYTVNLKVNNAVGSSTIKHTVIVCK